MDVISINQLKVPARIGVYPFEKAIKQTLLIDVSFEVDTQEAAESDDLNDAIDYEALAQAIIKFGAEHSFQLLESFGEHLAQVCLEQFQIESIKLHIQKPTAIKEAHHVGITLERTRTS